MHASQALDSRPAPAPRPAATDPARAIRTLKRVALGVTVLATAALGALVTLHPAGTTATTPDPLVESVPSGPVITAQDPFFDRSTASVAGSRLRRSSQSAFFRSSGS